MLTSEITFPDIIDVKGKLAMSIKKAGTSEIWEEPALVPM